ncbi:MAG: efflux RND transporter periplasmic adaptor subunit [Piscinibacter sp.]|uniref:efflux RND transporter periplasmic adaptor subunit n=1 Tax=Piscinibacter sp. TaxID=1903157 RepID=UPI00258C2386|nr:efflux RND transporter periplasmic adaptor subunit [Piscinibacter sp.]MCW5664995.1 efflux RND transporter periplasmic adaptor subunit [Piscinibacter sp.]
MNTKNRLLLVAAPLALAAAAVLVTLAARAADDKPAAAAPARPALTVTVTQPQPATMALKVAANGSIAAWQEASVGTEANGLRLAEVKVNVGDVVRRGQVLATFAPDTIAAELAQARAAVAEAEATLAEAGANAQRARELQATGALSAQAINQYLTAERTAQARLEAQRAVVRTMQLRLAQTQVLAPDHGVISARSATVGAVLPAGQELFRLIRAGRLEWRAEVAAPDLAQLKPGQSVTVTPAGGAPVPGKVRMLAPTVDPATRNGIVYVDLPEPGAARAGMFARGEFETGTAQGLSLPQSAVLLRDGFSYVLRVGPDSKVVQTKVGTGRRWGDRVEITHGIDKNARVVASGGGFLADGDLVRVVDAAPAAPAPQKTASSK